MLNVAAATGATTVVDPDEGSRHLPYHSTSYSTWTENATLKDIITVELDRNEQRAAKRSSFCVEFLIQFINLVLCYFT